MNTEPAPIKPIDLLKLRDAVKAYNDKLNSEDFSYEDWDSLNEVVRALNEIIRPIDPDGPELDTEDHD